MLFLSPGLVATVASESKRGQKSMRSARRVCSAYARRYRVLIVINITIIIIMIFHGRVKRPFLLLQEGRPSGSFHLLMCCVPNAFSRLQFVELDHSLPLLLWYGLTTVCGTV